MDYNIENLDRKIKVATVINSMDYTYDEGLFSTIVMEISKKADVILFPAGYYDYNHFVSLTEEDLKNIEEDVVVLLKETKRSTVVCIGLDINEGVDQLALAIDRTGIIAKSRKFYHTDGERGYIKIAENSIIKEDGYSRIFEVKDKRFYLAVCYDIFGIRHHSLKNPGVDYILNLIHGFNPMDEGNSGDVYFARLGLAGASKQWECPVFAATTYYRRQIPKKWPSGVIWNKGNESVQKWSYGDNTLFPIEVLNYDTPSEVAEVRIFEV